MKFLPNVLGLTVTCFMLIYIGIVTAHTDEYLLTAVCFMGVAITMVLTTVILTWEALHE